MKFACSSFLATLSYVNSTALTIVATNFQLDSSLESIAIGGDHSWNSTNRALQSVEEDTKIDHKVVAGKEDKVNVRILIPYFSYTYFLIFGYS